MPLQKQVLTVNLSQGIDTKTDPNSVVAGKLLVLENGVFTRPKSIRKRNGYQAFSATVNIPQTSTITAGQGLMTYLDELVLCDKSNLYSWDSSGSAWLSKGPFLSCNVSQDWVVRNTYQQTGQDSGTHSSGLQCFVWEDSQTAGARYCVIDGSTGQVIVPNTLILSTAIKPKVLTIGNFLLIVYVNTADFRIYAAPIAVTNPTAALVPVVLTAPSGSRQLNSTNPNYDATVVNTNLSGLQWYLFYNDSTPTTGGVTALNFTAATPTTAAQAALVIVAEAATVINVFGDLYRGNNDNGPVVAYYNGSIVKYRAYTSTMGTLLGSGNVEAVANVVSLSGVSTSTSTLSFRIYYSVSAAQTYNYSTRINTITGSYVVGTPSILLRSVALFAKAFLYNGTAFVPLVYQSPIITTPAAGSGAQGLQSTYFIQFDGSPVLAAKMLSGLAGPIPTRASNGSAMLAESNALSTGTSWQIAVLQKSLLTTQGGQVSTLTGVATVTLNFFDTQNSYLRAQLGQNLHLSGGFLQMYDGISPVEHGFHFYPEPSVTTSTSGGLITAGTYQYAVTYEWMDNQGQIHRSAPSLAITRITTGATSSNTITIPTLRVTAKTGSRPVVCVVYRTQNAGTTFYQISGYNVTPVASPSTGGAPVLNDTASDQVTFLDTQADSAIVGNPLLYTTGNVLPNLPPNAVSSLTVHQNRLFAVDTTNPLSITYSKQVVPGAPVEFSQGFLNLNIDPRYGNPTAVAGMDDKLIVFKPSSIFFVIGQGPDATGGQNDFQDAKWVTSDAGCANPRSIILVPNGLMFQSTKGIYLLSRSLSVSYVGAAVEAYNSQTVTSAQLIQNTSQVRFTLSSGVALVYDYYMDQWSTFTNVNAVDSTLFQNLFTYLSPTGTVFQETPGVFSDAGSFIKLRLVTSWLQFAGVQGFQRIYKALILGNYESAHQLLVQVAYDLNPAFTQQSTVTPTTSILYGADSVYGGNPAVTTDSTVYGGPYPLYQWRVFPQQQKCEAIQLSIEDVSTGTIGEAMNLSALTLEVGVKRGAFKLPASSSVG